MSLKRSLMMPGIIRKLDDAWYKLTAILLDLE